MAILLFILQLLFLPANLGFLLDGNSSQPSNGPSGQFLTLSTFYDQKRQIDFRIDQLQRDHDNKLNILASQIQQKFIAFDNKLGNTASNGTSMAQNGLDSKLMELETNNTYLKNKLNMLENKFSSLLGALEKLENSTESNQNAVDVDIERMNNQTAELMQQFTGLSQFRNFTGLQDYFSLQEKVRLLDSNLQKLILSEKTQSRDFRSLYDRSLTTGTLLNNLDGKITRNLNTVKQTLNSTNQHSQIIESNLGCYKSNTNGTILTFRNSLSKATETVSITAFFRSTSYYRPNYPLKFTGVTYAYGVANLDIIKSNGTFICEKEGLYLISISMTSYSSGTKYVIHYNGMPISVTYIGVFKGPEEHTADSSVVLELKPADQIWIQLTNDNPRRSSVNIYGFLHSRMSIVKLK